MKKLYRSENNRVLCGVCGGIAEYFEMDAALVRISFIIFSMACGSGVLAYLAASVIMPYRKTPVSENEEA